MGRGERRVGRGERRVGRWGCEEGKGDKDKSNIKNKDKKTKKYVQKRDVRATH